MREHLLTPLDIDLLQGIAEEGSLAAVCRSLRIARDRGVYRLRRLERTVGVAVVRSTRGGRTPGGSTLTPAGAALLRRGVGSLDQVRRSALAGPSPRLSGVWRARPQFHVDLEGGPSLFVGFRREEGAPVDVAILPDAVLVARDRFVTSARNVLRGRVMALHTERPWRVLLEVDVGGARFPAWVTPEACRDLRLSKGAIVYLYVKANAIRPVSRGRRRGPRPPAR